MVTALTASSAFHITIATLYLPSSGTDRARRGSAIAGGGGSAIAGRMIESIERRSEGGVRRANPAALARPEDIASTIAFLASPEARHVNGAAFVVDGGSTLI